VAEGGDFLRPDNQLPLHLRPVGILIHLRREPVQVRLAFEHQNLAQDFVSVFGCRVPDQHGHFRVFAQGTKGPIVYEFTRRRVILSAAGLPQKTVWLLIRRNLGDDRQYAFFISNASSSTSLKTLVWLSGLRWAIEQCFEETKTELGMDHYEVRKFPGWQHHMLTCILAHFFLWHLKIRTGKKSTIHYALAA